MSKVVLLVLLAFLQQGGAVNVKNLPEIVHQDTAVGDNEVAGQITVHCPSQPSQALDYLLLYLNAQDSLEGQLEQLKNKTDNLDGQLQQLTQQEMAEFQATVEALQTTISNQDNIIQQQTTALQQLQGTLQQLETTNQQQENSLQQLENTNQHQATILRQQEITIQQQASMLQQLNTTLQQQVDSLQQQGVTLQQQGVTLQQQEATLQQHEAILQQQAAILQQQAATLQQQAATLQHCTTNLQLLEEKITGPRTCKELLNSSHNTSGVYTIYPSGEVTRPIDVYCDMDTNGGGWTVFQRRKDGTVDFFRDWQNYKTGFGDLGGEFWLGNDNLHHLTAQGRYELRVDLADFEGNSAFAKYSNFSVDDEGHKYRLTVGGYSGNAGDGMAVHSSMFFSSKDERNDIHESTNCAQTFKGGWWYARCHLANLNGQYHGGAHQSYADGVNWGLWKGQYYSLKHTEMKIRPL